MAGSHPLPAHMPTHDLCCPVSALAACRVLHSAARGELLVPRTHLATVQQRAFSVVGPSNSSLPNNRPTNQFCNFRPSQWLQYGEEAHIEECH